MDNQNLMQNNALTILDEQENRELLYNAGVFQPAVTQRSMMTNPMSPSGNMMTSPSAVDMQSGTVDFPDFGTNTRQTNQMGSKPETLSNPIYVPGYLSQMIGKWVRLEMLIGASIVSRIGRLTEVGASFVVLQLPDPSTTMLCDMYSIKFVSIVNNMEQTGNR